MGAITELPEVYFDRHRRQIRRARSVKEAISLFTSDFDVKDERYNQALIKQMNKRFKGNLEKVKAHLISELADQQENYETRDI